MQPLSVFTVVAALAVVGLNLMANIDDEPPAGNAPVPDGLLRPPTSASPGAGLPRVAQLGSLPVGTCTEDVPLFVTQDVRIVPCDSIDTTFQVVGHVRIDAVTPDPETPPADGSLTAVEKDYARRCAAAFPVLAQDVAEGSVLPVVPLPDEWPSAPHEIICLDLRSD